MSGDTKPLPSPSVSKQPDQKKNVVVLKNRSSGPFGAEQTIYLCGTSHVSKRSCEDVRQLIQAVKPQVVMLELCHERRNILNPVDATRIKLTARQHFDLWRKGQQPLFAIAYAWMLSSVAEKCEINPGEEFRVALEEAMKIQAMVALGDRPVALTIARSWASLGSFWQKTKFICYLLWAGLAVTEKEVETIMDSVAEDEDVLTEALKEFGKQYPRLLRPLIEERDEYMVYTLRQLAAQAQTVVAVVGAGHLKGMQEKWDAEIDFQELKTMPAHKTAKSPRQKWTQVILVTAAGSAAVASILYAVQWRRLQ